MHISKEFAVEEFDRFCVAMDLDMDPKYMDSEDRESLQKQKRVITEAIVRGVLVILESGEPQFRTATEPEADPITFYEPTGATFLATDNRKKGHDVGKINAMLADMTKQSPARFAKMKHRDYKICQAIILVFLG